MGCVVSKRSRSVARSFVTILMLYFKGSKKILQNSLFSWSRNLFALCAAATRDSTIAQAGLNYLSINTRTHLLLFEAFERLAGLKKIQSRDSDR